MVPTGRKSFAYITPEAVARHSKLVLLHVVDTPESMDFAFKHPRPHPRSRLGTSGAVKRTFTEEQLRNLTSQPRRNFLPGRVGSGLCVQSGAPGETIVKYAQENECTLIGIATHGARAGSAVSRLGSTADYVVHHFCNPCPHRPPIIQLIIQ